jgi:hypothetical protein
MTARRKQKKKRKSDGLWLTLAIVALIVMVASVGAGSVVSGIGFGWLVGTGATGLALFICALLPGRWLEHWRVVAVMVGLILLLATGFSGILFPKNVLTLCAFWVFHGLALVLFSIYGLVILRRAADEEKATGDMVRWWMVYPSAALMLGAGVGFFELQRLGLSLQGIREAVEHGLVPFGLVVFLGLSAGVIKRLQLRGRRFLMLVSGALTFSGSLGGIIMLWYAGGS